MLTNAIECFVYLTINLLNKYDFLHDVRMQNVYLLKYISVEGYYFNSEDYGGLYR